MIDRLIRALEATRLDLTVEELADALWLARFLPEQAPAPTPASEASASGEEPAPRTEPAAPRTSAPEATGDAPAPMPPPAPLVLPGEQRASLQGVPLRVPAAPALPDPLGLGRALRPLHRRVHSRRAQVIDETASAEQIAETRVWLPVLRPEQVRWLDLALVVDTGTSMALWRQTVAELRDLLQFHGAFRNVRVWRLPTDSSEGELRLLAGLGTGEEPLVESVPDELIDPEGRRLVMVVSDCVSRRWHTGEVPKLLELWGRAGPVVVVQVLPEQYWGRTALRNGPDVLLRAPFRGAPNARLLEEEDSGSVQEAGEAAPVVPVVTLEQASLAAWANLVAGGSATVQGFELRPAQALSPVSAGPDSSPSAQERIERFLSTASLPARKLAGLLAAVPVSLSVMNLIRETLVPEARQEHLAEVFLGGLLREPPGQAASTDPEEKLYDFWPGVRERLLDSLPAGSARNVLLRVSDFIVDRLGQARDFRAFLVDSTKDVTPFVEQHRAFATIAAHVLQRLGGAYADLAQRLTTTLQALPAEEEKAETPQEPVAAPHPEDWAIVMGVDHYQALARLWTTESEADTFATWLVSQEGGGLPESQVLQLRSPTAAELEEQFRQMIQKLSGLRDDAPVGRRLYLFLSGHGAEPPGQGPVLFLADFSMGRAVHVDGPQWARWFLRSGLFQEVVLLMDCSRTRETELPEADRFPKLEDLLAPLPPSAGSFFFGFSTSPGEHAYAEAGQPPGLFMAALLEGLSGRAADNQGDITASSLQRFVTLRMAEHPSEEPQVPEFKWGHEPGKDFLLFRLTPPPSRVRIHFHRIYYGLTAKISGEGQILEIKASQSSKPFELRRGNYKIELPQIARSWPLEVSGPEASISIDWAPSGLWVLVAGSAESLHEQRPLAWICDALGETLARAGHGLFVGDQLGVDERILSSFAKTLMHTGLRYPEPLFQVTPVSSKTQSKYNKALQRADAVVLIGGSGSTYALFERARAAKKLVLPLRGTGGISDSIYKQVRSNALNSGQERIRRMLEALDEGIDSPAKAVTLARQVAESLQTLMNQTQFPSDADAASELNRRGNALLSQNRYVEAEQAFHEALAIEKSGHANRTAALSGLGNVLSIQKRYAEAERAFREALFIQQQIYGTLEHTNAVASLISLGNVLLSQEQYAEAERTFRDALAIQERLYRTRVNADMAISLHDLGLVLVLQDRYKGAERAFNEALAIQERVYGTREHANVAVSLHGLGIVLAFQGRAPLAERVFNEALAIQERVYGTREHAHVAASLSSLGNVLSSQDRYKEAEQAFREALAIQERVYGTRKHAHVAISLSGLGNVLSSRSRYEEAEHMFREALAIQEHVYGSRTHSNVAISLHGLGLVLASQDRYAEAEQAFREALAIQERVYGTHERANVAASLHRLSDVLFSQQKNAEATQLLRESNAIEKRIFGVRGGAHPHRILQSFAQLRPLESR
ncbi:tetratricopeptide (TPR) repeat protein [Archangium gephyra]|uniref:Kinesin light chain n=1 Tax=Archangium gephyra TaxID=48 RepID=A0AAC8Q4T5_9BACT|nr:SAV_2336 N-terminal domain-related protein [Archangium gephyra]AKJ01099.1 Kinesin light chain [Archangium gephyra]REG24584.1 tetratricopeptide (TPR) repeat protein [Archangium gephyra]